MRKFLFWGATGKRLLLIGVLLGSLQSVAMEMATSHGGAHLEKTIKLCLVDEMIPELQEVELPVRLALLIGSIRVLVEDPLWGECVIPLPMVTRQTWRFLEPQLERVYAITHRFVSVHQLSRDLMNAIGNLESNEIIKVLEAISVIKSETEALKNSDKTSIASSEIVNRWMVVITPLVKHIKRVMSDDFNQVCVEGLIELLRSVDYMNVPILLEAATRIACHKLSAEQIAALPYNIQKSLTRLAAR